MKILVNWEMHSVKDLQQESQRRSQAWTVDLRIKFEEPGAKDLKILDEIGNTSCRGFIRKLKHSNGNFPFKFEPHLIQGSLNF